MKPWYEDWDDEEDLSAEVSFIDLCRAIAYGVVFFSTLALLNSPTGRSILGAILHGALYQAYFLYAVWPGAWTM